jgi:hypothetical protein
MGEIIAKAAYFIKLGRKGEFEEERILHDNTIKLGFANPLHSECLAGKWDKVYEYWINQGKKKGKATEIKNQIRNFYEADQETLWITFFRRRLYWCFAEKEVTQLADGRRIRKVKGKWEYHDIQGFPLTIENLSGKLTKVQGFQGTICSVGEEEFKYLVRRINHQKLLEVEKAEETSATLLKDIEPLIQNLTWKDFELLVDLVFTHAGWQRISTLGKTERSIDLDLMSPVTGNRAFVQIKAKSKMAIFEDYIKQYKSMKEFNEMYFVIHTADNSFKKWQDTSDIKLWDVTKLSKLVVTSGLISWLFKKAS